MPSSKIRKSLRYSIFDGAFYSAMVGFGESFLSVFAIFLKATNLHLGLLGSVPQALGSFSQLLTNRLLRIFKSRKLLVCIGVLLQALMYIPIALVFFLGTFRIWHLILFVSIYWILGMIVNPAWSSWMGDLVDERERGRYFGKRNKIASLVSFVTFVVAGYLLQRFLDGSAFQYIGFVIIFALAMISRIMSLVFVSKQYEPKYDLDHVDSFKFTELLRQEQFRNYGFFAVYLALMNFAVYLSAPFFNPYMFRDLNFDYHMFTIVNAVAIIVKVLTMPVWGKLSDSYGTKKVLAVSGYMMPFVPLMWVLSGDIWYLILVQVYSGFIWAGFELASFNFIFDTTTTNNRSTCIAYYNVLNGIAVIVGAVLGSLIVKYNSVFWSAYLFVFLLSFMLRFLMSAVFLPKLKEVRLVKDISTSRLFFKAVTTIPNMGLVHEIVSFRNHHHLFIRKKGK